MTHPAVTQLKALVADIAEELEDTPTLGGLLDVLSWSAPSFVALPPSYKVTLASGKRYKKPVGSIADELSDAIFVDAGDLVTGLGPFDGDDPKAATQNLEAALCVLLRDSDIELKDVRGGEVAAVTLTPAKFAKPKPGAVVAIPAAGGGYRLASVITRNAFGTAFGIVDGVVAVPDVGAAAGLPVLPRPYYTDDHAVTDGVWRVVGYDDVLWARFPQDPEIYHQPPSQVPGIDLGEFGGAETAGGELRLIGADEAREVGLGAGYQQTLSPEELQQLLDER